LELLFQIAVEVMFAAVGVAVVLLVRQQALAEFAWRLSLLLLAMLIGLFGPILS
jgi:hypothetical protein